MGSIGSQRALGWKRRTPAEIDATLVALADRVTGRMRRAGRAGRTVVLRIRFDDLTRATRSHTLPEATAQTQTLLAAARELLEAAMPSIRTQGLTLIGVAFSNLEGDKAVQLALQLDRRENRALDAALDELRDRFGSGAIKRAVLLGQDEGQSVPLLPD